MLSHALHERMLRPFLPWYPAESFSNSVMTLDHFTLLNRQLLECLQADATSPVAALSGIVSGTSLEERIAKAPACIGSFQHLDSMVRTALQRPSLAVRFRSVEREMPDDTAHHADESVSTIPNDVRALVLLRAMIAAANADGEIDSTELVQIENNSARLQLPESARAWLRCELKTPRNVYSIASITEQPADAVAAYIVSHLIVDHENEAEQAFLDELAGALQLTPRMVMEIEQVLHDPT